MPPGQHRRRDHGAQPDPQGASGVAEPSRRDVSIRRSTTRSCSTASRAGRRRHGPGRRQPRSAHPQEAHDRNSALGMGACRTTRHVAVDRPDARPPLRWTGKIQRIRLDPADLPFAIWRIAPPGGVTMDARSVQSAASATIRSGTRTRSSISCTSNRSSTQQRRCRRFPRPDLQARLHRRSRRQHDLAAAVLSFAAPRRRLRHQRLSRRASRLRHAGRFPPVHRAPRMRAACGSSPNWWSTTPRTSIRWFQRARRAKPGSVCATSMSGPTTTRSTPARASSSSTRSAPTGPGTRWPAPTTGIGSIRTSPI